MHKTFLAFVLFSLSLVFVVFSCKKDDGKKDYTADADCSGVVSSVNTYTNSISIIMGNSCATVGCHNELTAADGIDLSNYANTKNAFENKAALCSIHHGSECKPMPEGAGKLDDVTINLIDCWVKSGYPE